MKNLAGGAKTVTESGEKFKNADSSQLKSFNFFLFFRTKCIPESGTETPSSEVASESSWSRKTAPSVRTSSAPVRPSFRRVPNSGLRSFLFDPDPYFLSPSLPPGKDVMLYVAEMIPKLKTRTQKGGADTGSQQGEGGKKSKKKKK